MGQRLYAGNRQRYYLKLVNLGWRLDQINYLPDKRPEVRLFEMTFEVIESFPLLQYQERVQPLVTLEAIIVHIAGILARQQN